MVLVGALVTLLVCAAVFAVGRGPERAAVLVILAGLAVSLALQAALGFSRQLPVLLADIGLAAGFIQLAHRYRRVWLGLMSLLAIALLVVHASLAEAPFPVLRLAIDGLNLVGLGLLVGGAAAERRSRLRASPSAGVTARPLGARPTPS